MILLFFVYILFVNAEDFEGVCSPFSKKLNVKVRVATKDAGCPGSSTGSITFTQLTNISEETSNIKYLVSDSEGNEIKSDSNTFPVREGEYKLSVIYSFEDRIYDIKNENSVIKYDECIIDLGKATINSQYEAITDIKGEVTGNSHCAGNYGTIVCSAKTEVGLLKYSLSGTVDRDPSMSGEFNNLPVGTYRCVIISDHCTQQSEELQLDYKSKCTNAKIWMDRQIFGEGRTLFIAGVILIALGLMLNFVMISLCIHLIKHPPKYEDKKKKKRTKKEGENEKKDVNEVEMV